MWTRGRTLQVCYDQFGHQYLNMVHIVLSLISAIGPYMYRIICNKVKGYKILGDFAYGLIGPRAREGSQKRF